MSLKLRLLVRLMASVALVQLSTSALLANENPVSPASPSETSPTQPIREGDVAVSPATAMGDPEYLSQIFKAYRSNDWTEALILTSKLSQPAAVALADWFAIRSGIPMKFDRLMAFRQDYPDWPLSAQIRRRTEDALLTERKPPSVVRAFFEKQAPISGAARVAFAFALKAEGLDKEAEDLIRHAWREDSFGKETEDEILERFPGVLGQADHRYRMERLLFRKNWSGATRAANRAGKEFESLVKARMGAFAGKKKAEKAFAAVPAALRKDASYLFSRALFLRRSNKLVEAANILKEAPRDQELRVDGDEWWDEQRYVARELMDKKNFKLAYEVASHHAAESPTDQIEAEFHAGWIALRFLNDPATAGRHFATVAKTASTPISIARVAYWQGRAAEAAGAEADAKLFYERAADKPTTYYGQLALEKLGRPLELRAIDPLPEEARRTFEARIPVQAIKLLQQIGETDLALSLSIDLAQTLSDPGELDALASLAASQQNARAVLAVGKIATQRGFPLDLHAYPVAGIPEFQRVGDEVETAMVYAIARQESAFNPKAMSSAGARGLMQLMPATAKRTAKRFGVGFDLDRLIQDPSYNAKIGAAHLGELMEDWKGSHILAFASYNAGGGNVMKWVKAYGDPRKPHVDTIDWIERIPFYETRNYVQRVMENLAVYRYRLKGGTPSTTAQAKPVEY